MNYKLHQAKHFIRHLLLATRKGHGVHSPFAFQLCEEVFYNKNDFYDFEKLDRLRRQLEQDGRTLEIEDHGAGSQSFKSTKRTISNIAVKGISSKKQSEILYRLCNFLNCRQVIELGTSVGLNTLYLALSNKQAKVVTIEGSFALNEFAKKLATSNKINNIHFIQGKFDDVLPGLLKEIKNVDLLYVDGNHQYEATSRYFNEVIQHTHNDSVIIFDDIYWSPGMTRAWNEIKKHPSVRLSIDTFYFGIVFFKEEIKEPVHLRLLI